MPEVEEFLDTFVQRQEEADAALHYGNPEPRRELWSRKDPITLLGAFGVAATGWDEVTRAFEWVASKYASCERFRLEVIAAGVHGDFAYTVGYEYSLVSLEGGPLTPNRHRVTHVYRRENGDWKIVHRHADGEEAEVPPAERDELS